VNAETRTLIDRPYGDLVDDLLTAIVGGVVNEPQRFDIKLAAYPLAEPAAAVRGITGTHDGAYRAFIAGIDFAFSPATNTVTWLDEGTHPDDDTTFRVDYFRVNSRSPLTDINVGSVTRTLSEAIGREIALVYETINLAYLSAFLDSAEGTSLDLVVAILGVTRKTAEFAEGLVTFFRTPDLDGNITIPAGLRLATATGTALFVVTQQRTLQQGQVRIDVPVRADEGSDGELGLVEAGTITTVVEPVAGIARATNLDPTVRAAADETDAELRERARAALRSLGKATLAALQRVILEGSGVPVEFFDPNGPLLSRSAPGTISVVLEAEPERLESLRTAVHQTRAAGVVATLVARYVFATPRVVATITRGITPPGQEQIRGDLIAAMQATVDALGQGDTLDGTVLRDAIAAVDDVAEATIVDVVVRRADLSRPPDLDPVGVLVAALDGVDVDDPAAVRLALERAVTDGLPDAPTDVRIPDRTLLRSTAEATDGAPATDADIEAATFEVVATVAGEDWWIALDVDPGDVQLVEVAGAEA
jgi:hypothetical protein